jgi:hypothetical protein
MINETFNQLSVRFLSELRLSYFVYLQILISHGIGLQFLFEHHCIAFVLSQIESVFLDLLLEGVTYTIFLLSASISKLHKNWLLNGSIAQEFHGVSLLSLFEQSILVLFNCFIL